MNGKGSKQRPQKAPDDHVKSEWDRLFPKKKKESAIKYQQMSRPGLHAISDQELRADKADLESMKVGTFKEIAQNRKELSIITTEIARRPMIPEDVFNV